MACTCLYTCLSLFIQFGMKTLEKTSPPWSANRLRKKSSKLRTKEQGSLCVVLDIDVRIMLQPRETWIAVTMLSINSYLDFEIFGYEWTQWCRMYPSIKAILANWVWWRAPDAYHFEYFSKMEAGQKTHLVFNSNRPHLQHHPARRLALTNTVWWSCWCSVYPSYDAPSFSVIANHDGWGVRCGYNRAKVCKDVQDQYLTRMREVASHVKSAIRAKGHPHDGAAGTKAHIGHSILASYPNQTT